MPTWPIRAVPFGAHFAPNIRSFDLPSQRPVGDQRRLALRARGVLRGVLHEVRRVLQNGRRELHRDKRACEGRPELDVLRNTGHVFGPISPDIRFATGMKKCSKKQAKGYWFLAQTQILMLSRPDPSATCQ